MFNVGTGELIVILVLALIVLGPEKLPTAARQAGRYLAEFRRISNGFQQEFRDAVDSAMGDTGGGLGGLGPLGGSSFSLPDLTRRDTQLSKDLFADLDALDTFESPPRRDLLDVVDGLDHIEGDGDGDGDPPPGGRPETGHVDIDGPPGSFA